MSDTLTLSAHGQTATIGARGAELLSWHAAGQEWMWHGDPAFWPRRAPILFPVCGWMNGGILRARGRRIPCGVHGFGPDAAFALTPTGPASLRASLRDTEETRAAFPFAFEIDIDITLIARGLSYDFVVRNPAGTPLPFALGFHPGFVWPFAGGDKSAYTLEFEEAEVPLAPKIAPGGLFTSEMLPVPFEGKVLNVVAGLDRPDALALLNARSRSVIFRAPGGQGLRVRMRNFPHWVFWSRPGGDYLCIEGWTGHGDPVGFTGDIRDKPGQILLPPGEASRHGYQVEIL